MNDADAEKLGQSSQLDLEQNKTFPFPGTPVSESVIAEVPYGSIVIFTSKTPHRRYANVSLVGNPNSLASSLRYLQPAKHLGGHPLVAGFALAESRSALWLPSQGLHPAAEGRERRCR